MIGLATPVLEHNRSISFYSNPKNHFCICFLS